MPDLNSNLDGTNISFSPYWAVQTTTVAEQKAATDLIKDTITAAMVSPGTVDGSLYTALINKPQLPAPPPGLGGANVSGFSAGFGNLNFEGLNPKTLMNNLAALMNGEQAGSEGLASAIESAVDGLSERQLQRLGQTPEQTKSALLFAIAHPEVAVSEEMRAMASSILQTAETKTGQTLDLDTVAVLDGALAAMQAGAFALALENTNLSPELKKLLKLADSIPALADALPQDLKAQLTSIQNLVADKLGQPFGAPAGWQLTNDAEQMAGMQFDQDVMGKLQSMLEDGKLTTKEFNALRSAYFSGQASTNPLLQSLVKELQAEQHIPAGYRFPVDAEAYQAMLNGATFAAFQEQIKLSALTTEQQAQLLLAMGSEETFQNLPADLKAIFTESKALAIDKVIAQYQVSDTWQPDIQALAIAVSNIGSQEMNFRQAMLNMLTEIHTLSIALMGQLRALPSGPEIPAQKSIDAYMDSVSAALLGLQDQLHAASTANAKLVRSLNVVNKDTTATKLEEQRKELADIKDAKSKQQIQAVASQYSMLFGMLIVSIIFPFLLPLFMAMMVAMIVMMAAGAAKGGQLDAKHGPLELAAQGAGMPVKMIWIMMTVMNPIGMLVMALCDLLFAGGKGIIEPCLKAYGVPQNVISKLLMVLQLLSVVAMLIIMLACAVIPGLQAVAAAMAEAIGALFGAIVGGMTTAVVGVGRVVKAVVESAIYLVRLLSKALEMAGTALKSFGPVGRMLSENMQRFAKLVNLFADELASSFNGAIQAGKSAMQAFQEALKQVSVILEKIEEAFGKAVSEVAKGIESVAVSFGKGAAGVSNKIGVQGAVDLVVQGTKSMYEMLIKTLEYLSQKFEVLLTRMHLEATPETRALNAQKLDTTEEIAKLQARLPAGRTNTPDALKQAATHKLEAENALDVLKAKPRSAEVAAQVAAGEQKVLDAQADLLRLSQQWSKSMTAEQSEKHAMTIQRLAVSEVRLAQTEAKLMEAEQLLASGASVFIEQMQLLFQGVAGVIQAAWGANTKIIEGQLALIKAAFEAYSAEVEVFLKILQATINKSMAQLQDLGDMTKRLVEMQQQMIKGMSECMTRLSSV